ncbi:MAG: oxaloacetate decarboxylase [Deltaproteobacteria bacterium]|jgi:methylisocitrate lyase|nr:oxaloacetate decarboxylase [Deltaproteobacteria bacterium]
MKKTALLQKYILEPEILVMPGAHDVLSARIIEKAGFKALAVGGYSATACLLGKPDLSFLTLTEMGDHIARLTGAVNLPALVDGDTGHGGVLNVGRTVKELERAGAAGIFIEDQVFPKRCGHMEGKQVVGREDMVAKIKAALDARSDPDFVIMARTDALAVLGLDEAMARGNLYRQAGADIIFVEAPRSIEDMRRINREINAPTVANMVEGGKTPFLPAQELEAIGYNAVVFPVSATYALAKAVSALMAELSRTGTTKGFWDQMWQFDDFYQFMGVDALRQKERNYHERGLAAVAVEQLQSKQVFSRSKSKRRRKS